MSRYLAVDPGGSGGIAWQDDDGIVQAEKCPDTMPEMVEVLYKTKQRALGMACNVKCAYLEDVHAGAFGGQKAGAKSMFTFGRNVGQWETALYALGIPTVRVSPKVWMAKLGGLPSGPDSKDARKKAIKERMQQRYPHLKVTLATADALAILTAMTDQN